MIRNALTSIGRRLARHEVVGADAAGNSYLRQRVKNDDGQQVERRWVEFPSEKGTHYYDAKEIPPEWHQWLTARRDEPPSAEAVLQGEAARNALRHKAAALEDAEIGQRLRAHAYGVHSQSAAFPHELPEPECPQQEAGHAAGHVTEQTPAADEGVGSWVPPRQS